MKNNSGLGSQSTEANFRHRKLTLALAIMGVGMLLAVIWAAVQGWGLGRGYPYNTFLFGPEYRFNDFLDSILDARRVNPYLDPYGIYLPFAWVFFRLFAVLPDSLGLTLFLFAGVGTLYVLLVATLADVVKSPWKRVGASLLLLGLSYPVLIAVDRANLEIYLALLMAGTIYFIDRVQYRMAAACLLVSVCFKMYTILFFALLFQRRRVQMVVVCIVAFLLIDVVSAQLLFLPAGNGLELYGRNLVFFNEQNFYENYDLEGCSSLWNVYKIGLVTAAKLGAIAPVDFSFDGSFIGTSYTVYSVIVALIAVALALHVCIVEREFLRCAIALLLYISIFTPLGSDYRLLYANIALVALVLLKTRRPFDLAILVLVALAMVPKKEFFLTYIGITESGVADVSIQAVLNPLLVLAALILLVRDSFRTFDSSQNWSRLRRQIAAIMTRKKQKPAAMAPAKTA